MDKEHAKGTIDHLAGKTKEVVGQATGNAELEAEGKVQQVKGSLHNAAGDIKDAASSLAGRIKAGTE